MTRLSLTQKHPLLHKQGVFFEKSAHSHTGFTIVELLIVIVIIAILATLVIVAYTGIQARARDASRNADIRAIKTALENYKADNSMYPAVCSQDNYGCSASDLANVLVPKYIKAIPKDPLSPTQKYDYVRGPVGNDAYGLKIKYENLGECKTGNNIISGWWTGVPIC